MCRFPSTNSPRPTMRDVARRCSLNASRRSAPKRRIRSQPRNPTAIAAAIEIHTDMTCSSSRPEDGPGPSSGVRSGARSVFARLGLVDLEQLAMHVATVESRDGSLTVGGVGVLDEAEALRLTARALGGDVGGEECAVWH